MSEMPEKIWCSIGKSGGLRTFIFAPLSEGASKSISEVEYIRADIFQAHRDALDELIRYCEQGEDLTRSADELPKLMRVLSDPDFIQFMRDGQKI